MAICDIVKYKSSTVMNSSIYVYIFQFVHLPYHLVSQKSPKVSVSTLAEYK